MIFKAIPFIKNRYLLAEGPFYDTRNNVLSFVDIIGKKLLLYKDGLIDEINFNEEIGAAVLTNEINTYLVCGTSAIYLANKKEIKEYIKLDKYVNEYQRCNDAKVDPFNRLFVGTSIWDGVHKPIGNLYMLNDDKELIIRQENTLISNGMAWNKACDKFYFSDSIYHKVFIYDYDKKSGEIKNRTPLFEVNDGAPDGLCIDNNDNIWVAVWGGYRVECHDGRTGELLHIVEVAANHVTSCCFMNDELIITTSANELDGESDGFIYKVNVKETAKEVDYFLIK